MNQIVNIITFSVILIVVVFDTFDMIAFNTDGLLTEKKKVPQDRRKYIDYLIDGNRKSTYELIV